MPYTSALKCRVFTLIASVVLVVMSAGAASAANIVYALTQVNGGPNQIYAFRINAAGGLSLLPGFPMPSGGNGGPGSFSEMIKYSGGRLYVINDGSDTLSAFTVNQTTGALTPMPFSPLALGAGNWG